MSRTLRVLRTRPRLWNSVAVGVATYLLVPTAWAHNASTRALIGWNACALLYLLLAWEMMSSVDPATLRRRAVEQNEGRLFVLVMVVLGAVAVLLATGSQLAVTR